MPGKKGYVAAAVAVAALAAAGCKLLGGKVGIGRSKEEAEKALKDKAGVKRSREEAEKVSKDKVGVKRSGEEAKIASDMRKLTKAMLGCPDQKVIKLDLGGGEEVRVVLEDGEKEEDVFKGVNEIKNRIDEARPQVDAIMSALFECATKQGISQEIEAYKSWLGDNFKPSEIRKAIKEHGPIDLKKLSIEEVPQNKM